MVALSITGIKHTTIMLNFATLTSLQEDISGLKHRGNYIDNSSEIWKM